MSTQEGFIGSRERYISVVESVYGTAPSFSAARVPGVNVVVTPNFTQGFQEVLNNGGDVRTRTKAVASPLGLLYDVEYSPINWHRLKYVFDIDSETGSDPYTHTLSIGNTIKSFSAEWAMQHSTDPLIFLPVGNVINEYVISFSKPSGEGREGFIRCKESIIAKDYTTPASVEAGTFTDTGSPFQFRHSLLTLNTTAVVPVNSGELRFTQGINPNDSRYASTSLDRTIGTPIVTNFRISGRFNLNLFATTYTTLWETAAAISGTNTLVFQISASNKITFTFTGMYVEPVPVGSTNLDGVNTGDFVFTADSVAVVAIDSIANW